MRRAVLCVLFCVPTAIQSQAPAIAAGTRVRIERLQAERVDGTVMSQTSDSITVSSPDATHISVASSSIDKLLVSGGRSRGRGALKGFKIGAFVGGVAIPAVVLAAWAADDHADRDGVLPLMAVYGVVAAVEFGAIGAIIGSLVGSEKWTTVYSSPLRVSVLPTRAGAMSAAVSIGF